MPITAYFNGGRAYVGKTMLGLEQTLSRGYHYATNQNYPRDDIVKILPLGTSQMVQVRPQDAFPIYAPRTNIVFDLAGELNGYQGSILSALRQAEVIVIPFLGDAETIERTALAVAEINDDPEITGRQLFVLNMIEGDTDIALGAATEPLTARLGYQPTILPMRRSTAFRYILKDGTSVSDLLKRGGLLASTFKRSGLANNIDNLMKAIHA